MACTLTVDVLVEFYFADSNLPFDKYVRYIHFFFGSPFLPFRFMWTLYTKDPDHWVPVDTVASFKRMREFNANGQEWIANALRLSDFLEVDETGTKVRRRTEVQEPKDSFERSVYAVCGSSGVCRPRIDPIWILERLSR